MRIGVNSNLDMKYAILNKKIKNFKIENQSVLKKDIISFYWSKKNPIVISSILDHFVEKNQTIFDPFLGSAQFYLALMQVKQIINLLVQK